MTFEDRLQSERNGERVDSIEQNWRSREIDTAHENVDRFLSERVEEGEFHTPPEAMDDSTLAEEFAEYLNYDSVGELSDVELEVLDKRRSGIYGELATAAAKTHILDIQMMTPARSSFDDVLQRFRDL